MARRSRTQITGELAAKIAKKLEARIDTSASAHDLCLVYERELLVASFGIRRGSRKGLGHDHIPREIHVSAYDARQLGNCPMSRAAWVDLMIEKGIIPAP